MKNKIILIFLISIITMLSICVTLNSKKTAEADIAVSMQRVSIENFTDKLLSVSDQNTSGISQDATVSVLIGLEGESLYEKAKKAGCTLTEYIATEEGKNYSDQLQKKQQEVMCAMLETGADIKFKYAYTSVINAIGGSVTYSQMKLLEEVEYVQKVSLSGVFNAPTTEDVENYSVSVSSSENSDKYRGSGSLIAIIDTGIDYNHDAFQTAPSQSVLTQEKFESVKQDLLAVNSISLEAWGTNNYKDYYTEELKWEDVYINEKMPFGFDYGNVDPDPYWYDNYMGTTYGAGNEHGTHVAGIAAGNTGNGYFEGVAPDAQILPLKVSTLVRDGTYGTLSQTIYLIDILAAVNDAMLLGADSMNISIGTSIAGFSNELNVDAFYRAAADEGVMIAVAAGNDYYSGIYSLLGNGLNTAEDIDYGSISAPASYSSVFTVASSNSYNTLQFYFLNNEDKITYKNTYSTTTASDATEKDFCTYFEKYINKVTDGLTDPFDMEWHYIAVPGVGADADYENLDLSDYPESNGIWDLNCIVLVQRGELSFEEKVRIAQAHGAYACIIYDNVLNSGLNIVTGAEELPSAYISLSDGEKLLSAQEKYLRFHNEFYDYQKEMSDFSSWGPLSTLELKPEITALGGKINSTLPDNTYGEMYGTSMSSPYIAGSLALVKQYVKDNFPEMDAVEISNTVYRIIMSTADIQYDVFNDGIAYSPRKQGAGLINLDKALSTETYIEVPGQTKAKIELLDDPELKGVYDLTFNIINFGETDIEYEVSAIVLTSEIIEGFHTTDSYDLTSLCTFSVTSQSYNGSKLLIPAGQSVSVTVSISLGEEAREYLSMYLDSAGGNYVDGFVCLESEEGCDLNVPYLAFFGDWTASPKFDYTSNEEDYDKVSTWYGVLWGQYGYNTLNIGCNNFAKSDSVIEDVYFDPDKCAIAPRGNGYSFLSSVYYSPFHNMTEVDFTISNATTGEIFYDSSVNKISKSSSATNYGMRWVSEAYLYFDGIDVLPFYETLPNNTQLKLTISGVTEFEAAHPERTSNSSRPEIEYTFWIDNELPQIISSELVRLQGRYYYSVELYDNQYLLAYSPVLLRKNGTNYTREKYLSDYMICINEFAEEQGLSYQYLFDVTEFFDGTYDDSIYTFGLEFYDYAMNHSVYAMVKGETDFSLYDKENTLNSVSENEIGLAPSAYLNNTSEEFVITEDGILKAYNGNGGDIIIPDNVKIIDYDVFYKNSTITSIIFNEGLTEIRENAFKNCSKLTSVSFPSTIEKIGISAFYGCKINTLNFVPLKSRLDIDNYAFFNNYIKELVLPENVINIGNSSFDRNEITALYLPNSIESIGASAFGSMNLSADELHLPEECIYVGEGAFGVAKKHLTVFIGKNLKYVDFGTHQMFVNSENIFYNISEENQQFKIINNAIVDCYGNYLRYQGENSENIEIVIPDNICRIGPRAFAFSEVGIVWIPDSVKSIGSEAFAGKVHCVVFETDIAPTLESEDGIYGQFSDLCKCYIPYGSKGFNMRYRLLNTDFEIYSNDNAVSISSIYFGFEESDSEVNIYVDAWPFADGAEIYKGIETGEGIEYTLLGEFEFKDKSDNTHYLSHILIASDNVEYFVKTYYYVVPYLYDNGEKVLGSESDIITVSAEPFMAYEVDNAILSLDVTSYSDKNMVEEVRQAYEDLTDERKAYITQLDLLLLAERKIEILELNELLKIDCGQITADDKEYINSLREEVNDVEEDLRYLISNEGYLIAAEQQLVIIDLMNEIESDRKEIDEIRKAYDEAVKKLEESGCSGKVYSNYYASMLICLLMTAVVVLIKRRGPVNKNH